MTLADTLLFVHIVAVVVWIGGELMLGILFERAQRARDEATLRGLLSQSEFIGKAVFNPAGIITLVAGVWLAIDRDFDFGQAWISIGFVGVAVGAGLGMAFYPKVFRRGLAAIEAEGINGTETLASLRSLRLVSTIELVVLLVAVWAMVFKPGA